MERTQRRGLIINEQTEKRKTRISPPVVARADREGRRNEGREAENAKINNIQWQMIREQTRKGEREKNKILDERKIKIGFWNVAGLDNKDTQFWDYIKKFDIIGMTETWIEEKRWTGLKDYLPEDFRWKCQHAKRERNKGRAMRGIITGVKKDIKEEDEDDMEKHIEEVQIRKVRIGNNKWNLVTAYNKKGISEIMKEIKDLIPEEKEQNLIIEGDFNARIGREGTIIWGNDRDEILRRSKDMVINIEGKRLLEEVGERGWDILNGNIEGDEEEELTYIGARGSSIIDYAIGNTEARDKIGSLVIEERTESDHLPICVYIQAEDSRLSFTDMLDEDKTFKQQIWTEGGIKKFREILDTQEFKETGLEESWMELKDGLNTATQEKEITIKKRRLREKKWWNKECRKRKKELRSFLRKVKRDKNLLEEYRNKRKQYQNFCKDKKEEFRKKEEEKIRKIKTETEA